MSVKAILTEQQKSYTKAEEDTLLATKYDKDYIDTYMAPLDTPTFIGTPKAPTAAAGTNTTQIATTAFVHEGLQRKSNPNLLRNWYFVGGGTGRGVFPVNSRGQTTYQNITYSVDGWYIRNTFAQVELTSSGLNLKKNTANYGDLGQCLSQETLNILSGKTVTLSWLDDVNYKSVTYTWPTTNANSLIYSSDGLNIYSGQLVPSPYNVLFQTTATQKIFKAVKLELGSEQTLCHNEGTEANPVWVLNDIPDYEYELYRCMTSTADSSDTFANKSLATQEQLAPVEWGTTASVQHEIGSYFCWNGLLYRTTVLIPVGGQITPNTNCVRDYAAVPSCYLSTITFQCNSNGSYTFANGDLPNRATSVPVGCLAKDTSNNYLNVSDFNINPRYGTAGIFTSVSCANKEVTLFFVNYR